MGQGTDPLDRGRRGVVYTTASAGRHERPSDRTPEDRDVATIRAEIARTRGDMSATIDAIQYKLEPNRIKRQVGAAMRGATIGKAEQMLDNTRDAGNGLLDRIRQNPIPAAMVAVGIGWLFTRPAERRHNYEESGYGADDHASMDGGGDVRDQVRARAGEMRDRLDERTTEVRDRIDQRTTEMRNRLDQRATELRGRAADQAQRARGSLEQMMDDNPLGLGAVALAVGAAIGLAAPSTARENELMGEAREKVMDKAQASAQEAVTKAKRVATNVAEDVRQETRQL